jgi:hypothetical protein
MPMGPPQALGAAPKFRAFGGPEVAQAACNSIRNFGTISRAVSGLTLLTHRFSQRCFGYT